MHAVDPLLTTLFGLGCATLGAAVAWAGAHYRSRSALPDARSDQVWEMELPDWFRARLDDIESRASTAPWIMRGVRGVAEEAARQRFYVRLGSMTQPGAEADE